MKKLIFILLIGLSTKTFAQGGAKADLKFEEAETAFNNKDYANVLAKLNEFDKLFGSVTARSLYLRIISADKLFNANKLYDDEAQFNSLASLHKNANSYLKAMESEGLDDKYREINAISEKLKKYPSDKQAWLKEKQRREAELKAVSEGAIAPNFVAKNQNNETVSLKENLGKQYTIINFWASWAKPSLELNKVLSKFQYKYQGLGLNIISVSLDKDKMQWQTAINNNKYTWTEVSNLQGWDEPIAKQYKITSIPFHILLDANGKIIARNFDIFLIENLFKEELDKYYKEIAPKIDAWEYKDYITIGGNYKDLKTKHNDTYKELKQRYKSLYEHKMKDYDHTGDRLRDISLTSEGIITSYTISKGYFTYLKGHEKYFEETKNKTFSELRKFLGEQLSIEYVKAKDEYSSNYYFIISPHAKNIIIIEDRIVTHNGLYPKFQISKCNESDGLFGYYKNKFSGTK